jgi:hypothetical protein
MPTITTCTWFHDDGEDAAPASADRAGAAAPDA